MQHVLNISFTIDLPDTVIQFSLYETERIDPDKIKQKKINWFNTILEAISVTIQKRINIAGTDTARMVFFIIIIIIIYDKLALLFKHM